MKGTVWCFGDSLSTPFNKEPFTGSDEYVDYKGYVPKIYPQIISEKLNMNLKYFSDSGRDNYSIFESVCEVADKIKEDDIIIIGWSHIDRFRVVQTDGIWKSILPLPSKYFKYWDMIPNFNKEFFQMMLVNRIDKEKNYADELNNWIKLLNTCFKDNKIIHWTAFKQPLINCIYFENIDLIVNETNGEIKDRHYSELGHQQLSGIFLDIINDTKKII